MKLLPANRLGLLVLLIFFPFQGENVVPIAGNDQYAENNMNQEQHHKTKGNRLLHEKSPYLLQHAYNPVDWFPWGEEAFEKARQEDKPIFLSIGYSTCYWCHVMEREVFENDSIAALMNKYVISIKVDREERPDIDRIYMAALQAMTGSGGWPMSMFLTSDRRPFFGATYIPPSAKYGRAGFEDVLMKIHDIWSADRKKILDAGGQIETHIRSFLNPSSDPTETGKETLEQGFQSLLASFDSVNGGFGNSPKFPTPVSLNFLLRYYHRTGEQQALAMTLKTLKNMHNGGIYDHLGGGFHRYSTDARWHVPHFEKMLYDQAQITVAYLEAFQITHDSFYAGVAGDILQYVREEMTHPEGGFYSAQDAESAVQGNGPASAKEGAFYVWGSREIDFVLAPSEREIFGYLFDIQPSGNVREDPHGEFRGLNILHRVHSMEETSAHFKVSLSDAEAALQSARRKLLEARTRRPRPFLDDKILLSWNGLIISAFAKASQVLDNREYLHAAVAAAEFILGHMMAENALLRRYRDGEARHEANLEDYAFFVQALLDLYEASLDIRWLQTAVDLEQTTVTMFYDAHSGGFFDTAGSDTTLLVRTKEANDGAEPSGNSIAILNLLRLSHITGNEHYKEMGRKSLQLFGERMRTIPHGMAQFLSALDLSLSEPRQVIIAGQANRADTQALLREIHSHFLPTTILLLADNGPSQEMLSSFVPFLKSIRMIDGNATAFVCENYTCQLPTNDVGTLRQQLSQ